MRDAVNLVLLAPILVSQGLWTAFRAARLPEAAGPRRGKVGHGRPLNLLVTGDSSAAGVGVDHQEQALAGQLAKALSDEFAVQWDVAAKSGGTTASTVAMLRATQPHPCDVALVALGVNDTKNGVSETAWRRHYDALIELLRNRQGAKHIYVSGLPPLGDFPLLPRPLRGVLGKRATRLDMILSQIAQNHSDVTHLPMDLPMDVSEMATDGFHPGAKAYTKWAQLIADQIRRDFS